MNRYVLPGAEVGAGVVGIGISASGGAASCATTFGFGCIAATVGVYTSSDHMITGLNNFGKKASEQNPTITVQGLKKLGLSEQAASYVQFALDTASVGKAGMSVPVKSAKPGYVANVGNSSGKGAGATKQGVTGIADQVPGRVQSRINVSNEGMGHVFDRHFDTSVNASQFTISKNNLRSLLSSKDVIFTPVSRIVRSGNEFAYVREVNIGRNIGLDKFGGNQPTSTLTVLTDKYGNLITTFPGRLK